MQAYQCFYHDSTPNQKSVEADEGITLPPCLQDGIYSQLSSVLFYELWGKISLDMFSAWVAYLGYLTPTQSFLWVNLASTLRSLGGSQVYCLLTFYSLGRFETWVDLPLAFDMVLVCINLQCLKKSKMSKGCNPVCFYLGISLVDPSDA